MQLRWGILIFFCMMMVNSGACQTAPGYITTSEIRRQFAACFEELKPTSSCTQAESYYTFIGLIDSALALNDKVYGYQFKYRSDINWDSLNSDLSPAREYILNHIGNSKIVMLNEQHYYSPNRIFTASLLEDLKKLGFNYFGCEGITYADILNSNGYPTVNIGTYPKEPQFANMIRVALELGYTVFGYENTSGGGMEARERGQAENIANIIRKDSSARIVIHAGLGHICEDSSFKAMGYFLKQITAIDPYTINQSKMLERSVAEYEVPLYRKIANNLKYPMVLLNPSRVLTSGFSCYDAEVCLPRTHYVNGRANWLYASYLTRHRLELPTNLDFPVLIKVYLRSEYDKNPAIAVPVDAIEVPNEQKTIDVFVPFKGDYLVQVNEFEPYLIKIQ
jgi:hypothetical protein